MTIYEKIVSLLKAFEIPEGEEEKNEKIRSVLARLLAARSLRLANLQTARDIVKQKNLNTPEAFLFLAAMFVSEGEGNAYMRGDEAVGLLVNGGYLDDYARMGFPDSNEQYEKTVKELCAHQEFCDCKDALVGDVVVQQDDHRWYFQRDDKAVKNLNEKFREFSAARILREIPDNVLEKAAKFKFELNKKQKEAVKAAAEQRFTIITGGPGTGKTTTVCAILRALIAVNPDWTAADIAIAAPTGRAAQRMQEAILNQCQGLEGQGEKRVVEIARELEGSTIHRLLGGYAPNWKHDEKHRLEQKVVIVDETSMVDLYLMQALLNAISDDAQLILLGDADQLPSVDTGAVLGDLTQIGMDSVIVKRLEVCERAKGRISEISKDINGLPEEGAEGLEGQLEKLLNKMAECEEQAGEMQNDADESKDGNAKKASEFHWFDPPAQTKKDWLKELYSSFMDGNRLSELADELPENDPALAGMSSEASKALFEELNARRILTLVREGVYGVKEANAHLLKMAKGGRKNADYLSIVGVPIMVTKNTPERMLFNGDVGVTVKGPHGMVVLFPRGEKTIVCPVSLLPEHELAFAMTVHKSQGSEFDNVMVILPNDEKHPLLNRQIVYTGITRAKIRAIVIGTENVLKVALSRKLKRNTGIDLQSCIAPGQPINEKPASRLDDSNFCADESTTPHADNVSIVSNVDDTQGSVKDAMESSFYADSVGIVSRADDTQGPVKDAMGSSLNADSGSTVSRAADTQGPVADVGASAGIVEKECPAQQNAPGEREAQDHIGDGDRVPATQETIQEDPIVAFFRAFMDYVNDNSKNLQPYLFPQFCKNSIDLFRASGTMNVTIYLAGNDTFVLGLYAGDAPKDKRRKIIEKMRGIMRENPDLQTKWGEFDYSEKDLGPKVVKWNLNNEIQGLDINNHDSLFKHPERKKIFDRVIEFFTLLQNAGIEFEPKREDYNQEIILNKIRVKIAGKTGPIDNDGEQDVIKKTDASPSSLQNVPSLAHTQMRDIPKKDYSSDDVISPTNESLEPVLCWVTSVEDLFNREAISVQGDGKPKIKPGNYVIPNYQRKYAWNTRQIDQLCRDLLRASADKNTSYHLGTLIFHRDNDFFYVVDGQQRLTTISILLRQKIFYEGDDCADDNSNKISTQQFTETDKKCIDGVFQNYPDEERDKIRNTLENSTFICISVSDIIESFQLFSTQNGRGRPLTPVNLLKAYHFHEIGKLSELKCNEDESNKNDRIWEKLNAEKIRDEKGKIREDGGLLSHVIGEHLYRLRNWCRGEFPEKVFSVDNINEFKGLTPVVNENSPKIPLQNIAVLRYFANKKDDMRIHGELLAHRTKNDNMNLYMSIDQPIINGEDFFEYARSYAEAYRMLFGVAGGNRKDMNNAKQENKVNELEKGVEGFRKFYQEKCLYGLARRRGDTYARHVFESLCLFCFDRFGEYGLLSCHEELYCCAYYERLVNSRCYYSTCGREFAIKAIRYMFRSMTLRELKESLHDLFLEIRANVQDKLDKQGDKKLAEGIKDFVKPVFRLNDMEVANG